MKYPRIAAASVIVVTGFLSGVVRWLGWLVFLLSIASKMEAQVRVPPLLEFNTHDDGVVLIEYAPFPVYETWWKEIAACQGLPLPVAHKFVRYFAINVREYHAVRGSGGWSVASSLTDVGQMYFAFPYVLDRLTFEHEATHFLMDWAGEWVDPKKNPDTDHPAYRFDGKCGLHAYRRPILDYR